MYNKKSYTLHIELFRNVLEEIVEDCRAHLPEKNFCLERKYTNRMISANTVLANLHQLEIDLQ